METLNYSPIAGKNVKYGIHTGNHSSVLYKTKHTITLWPSNCTQGHLFYRNENLCLPKNLHTNVNSGFIHNSQELETARCPSQVND